MEYIEVKIEILAEHTEIIIAELIIKGYDSFLETETGLDAYIEEGAFSEEDLKEIISRHDEIKTSYSFSKLENKNWNEEWEKNFQPVEINEDCIIRASFHPLKKPYKYDIVINPKMSFGTGHHETTSMMIENQLETDHAGKKVMDAGSGTGILAIMASKLGAAHIDAFDVEEWAFENLKENINLNDCSNINCSFGDISKADLKFEKYEIILANINKNVLLEEIPLYSEKLENNGLLILSGFYTDDVDDIEKMASSNFLIKTGVKEKNRWASVIFKKLRN